MATRQVHRNITPGRAARQHGHKPTGSGPAELGSSSTLTAGAVRSRISRDCILFQTARLWTALPYQNEAAYRARMDRYTSGWQERNRFRLIVRRGASRRFDALARKTADLPVVVSWDRRTEHRRASPESVPVERRSSDRRKTPPFTWDAADFVVVDATREPEATAPPPITRLEGQATSKAGIAVRTWPSSGAKTETVRVRLPFSRLHGDRRDLQPHLLRETQRT